jgi:RHS repeat-associated protein
MNFSCAYNRQAYFAIDEFFTGADGVGMRALLPDALGSTVALGDNAGTLQTQYTYEPFGFVSQTGAASTNSYKFTGREDDGTGLVYYRMRYYYPKLQRFVSEDPIGFWGRQVNLYGYVRNAPTIYIDPYGLIEGKLFPNIPQIPYNPKRDPVFHVPPSPDPFQGLNRMIEDLNQCKTFELGGPPGTGILNGDIDLKAKPWPPSIDLNGFNFRFEYRF